MWLERSKNGIRVFKTNYLICFYSVSFSQPHNK